MSGADEVAEHEERQQQRRGRAVRRQPERHRQVVDSTERMRVGGAWQQRQEQADAEDPAPCRCVRLHHGKSDLRDQSGNAAKAAHVCCCSMNGPRWRSTQRRSEEHTSELQSLMRISYAVFCLKKKKHQNTTKNAVPHMQHQEYEYAYTI